MPNNSFITSNSSEAVQATQSDAQPRRQRWLLPLLTRLHFYVGLLVGPFLLIAALSGVLYALTPQIEDAVYQHELYTPSTGAPGTLADQIIAAQSAVNGDARLFAVRPAPEAGTTTRVMFIEPGMGPSENRAIFVDPVTAEVRGDLGVYGTSGVLPVRAWIDLLHRGLHLGDIGRLYSELAASWLWIAALGGFALWLARWRSQRGAAPVNPAAARHRVRRWHRTFGLFLLIGVLFFSVTGLTWSQWAGANISTLRAYYGWGTPTVSTNLDAVRAVATDEHAHHKMQSGPAPINGEPAMFDAMLAAARAAGIDAGKVEIRPPAKPDKAWTVTEIDRSWPTQVDAVAIDPRNMAIVDQTRFSDFPLAAKLTRWGIDAHMGALFGVPNQLALIFFASGLVTMVIWGYVMWWHRRPARNTGPGSHDTLFRLLRKVPPVGLAGILVSAVAIGWFLPLMGISLVLFLLFDLALHWSSVARSQ
ncbi:PepSY domain-containing protein [Candidimonas sp. SYP-B2681]|uniref:PepSY-associated TM helix domain-containing protein n=1 Tax=Candidimonas sp. SYP-B2681 TaxID=2497686 RepID=UPI000F860F2E|nr:PepSY-associated TM helix domain-containing protein [Candidimonas sp. SYP-B2681]RTZ39166.1 PepSY domain-containing protein [Candidimonas sp. SYP-B2681]